LDVVFCVNKLDSILQQGFLERTAHLQFLHKSPPFEIHDETNTPQTLSLYPVQDVDGRLGVGTGLSQE
jgi:hypothetical protein